jgi:hypothetical protein
MRGIRQLVLGGALAASSSCATDMTRQKKSTNFGKKVVLNKKYKAVRYSVAIS